MMDSRGPHCGRWVKMRGITRSGLECLCKLLIRNQGGRSILSEYRLDFDYVGPHSDSSPASERGLYILTALPPDGRIGAVNTLQFVDSMTGRLAWPIAALILGLVF